MKNAIRHWRGSSQLTEYVLSGIEGYEFGQL